MNDNKQDPSQKVELAKKIANQSKRVTKGYENVEATVFRFIRFMSSLIDKMFFAPKHLGLVSLLLAIFLYFSVNYSEGDNNIAKAITNAKTLNNVSVTARYNDEIFEISGVPATCQVILIGDAANVNAAAARSGNCLIDLEGYTEGTHSVPLVTSGYGTAVTTSITPSETLVTLKRKTTAQFELEYDFINKNQLDSRYILGQPTFEGDTTIVNIRASQDTLDSIAMVKALIDVKGQTSDFTVDAPLVAYDAKGNVVNAEIDPTSIKASVAISSPHKTVPLTLSLSGNIANNIAIDSIQMDHQSTVIYASEAVLANINDIKVNINVSELASDTNTTLQVPITLPSGVASSDVTNVNLEITLGPLVSKVIDNIPIVYRNNDNGYGASDVSTSSISVTVSGTERNISSISSQNITAFIDIEGLEPGTHDLPIQLEYNGNMFVNCVANTESVHITLVTNE